MRENCAEKGSSCGVGAKLSLLNNGKGRNLARVFGGGGAAGIGEVKTGKVQRESPAGGLVGGNAKGQ